MRFPLLDRCALPCVFERFVPGRPHPDGRRYLPLIVLRLPDRPAGVTPPGLLLGVVDRHHRVNPELAGRPGVARLVFALSSVRTQPPPGELGLLPEPAWSPGDVSTAPVARAQVREVAAWEEQRGQLPYDALYTELLLDVGAGTVGLRTNVTADDLAAAIGAARLAPGDFVELGRSRIDILSFEPGE